MLEQYNVNHSITCLQIQSTKVIILTICSQGGLHVPMDGALDPSDLCRVYAKAAAQRGDNIMIIPDHCKAHIHNLTTSNPPPP